MSQIPQPNILQLDHRMAEKSRARGYMEKSLPMDPHNLHLFYLFFWYLLGIVPIGKIHKIAYWIILDPLGGSEIWPLPKSVEDIQNIIFGTSWGATKLLSSWNLDESLAMGSYGAIRISCSSVPLPLCKGHGRQEIDPPPIHSDEEVNFTCLKMGCQWIHSWLVKFGDVHAMYFHPF